VVDRIRSIAQSKGLQNCLGRTQNSKSLKKALLILAAVVLTPVLVVSFVLAAGDWRSIGQTQAGDKVYISSVRVLKNNQRTALVRVEYHAPTQLPQGGPFVEMRARVRFDCRNGQATPTTEWFYSRDRSGRFVVSKKASRDDQFGKAAEGGFLELVSSNVCGASK
jgi:surface-adhesin protein E